MNLNRICTRIHSFKYEIFSCFVLITALLVVLALNEKSVNKHEIDEIRSKITKFEKISDTFLSYVQGKDQKSILRKLNEYRNFVLWNNDKGPIVESKSIKYPVIVNVEGRSLENNTKLINLDSLIKEKTILLHGNTLILVYPFFVGKEPCYFLIPLKVPYLLNIQRSMTQDESLNNSYDFSLPLSFSQLTYHLYLWGVLVVILNFLGIYYCRKRIEHRLACKITSRHIQNLRKLRDIKTQLKSTKTTVYDLQSLTYLSNQKILRYAIKYVSLYKNVPDIFQNMSLPHVTTILSKKNTLQIVDIFKDKEIDFERIISDNLDVFGSEIKRLNLIFEQEYKGKGKFFSDEDLISSLLIIALHGVVRTATPNGTIRMQTVLKEGSLVISIAGGFSASAKHYEYPKFVKKHFYTNKNITTHKIIIDPLIPSNNITPEKSNKNANVITLFNG